MKDIRSMLREGDPIATEGVLSLIDTRNMRDRLQSAAVLVPPMRSRSLAPLFAVLLVLTAGAIWSVHSVTPQSPPRRFASNVAVRQQPLGVRQLQFVTAGGTRVFWTFHPKTEAR